MRILVIDDYPPFATSLRLLLAAEHEVEVASGGRAALELLARDDHFGLILCDLQMPEVSGESVWRALQAAGAGLERRIVFMTGNTCSPDAERFLSEAGNPRVEKPFEPAVMLDLARRAGRP